MTFHVLRVGMPSPPPWILPAGAHVLTYIYYRWVGYKTMLILSRFYFCCVCKLMQYYYTTLFLINYCDYYWIFPSMFVILSGYFAGFHLHYKRLQQKRPTVSFFQPFPKVCALLSSYWVQWYPSLQLTGSIGKFVVWD